MNERSFDQLHLLRSRARLDDLRVDLGDREHQPLMAIDQRTNEQRVGTLI